MKLPELKRRFKNKYVIRIAAGVLTVAVVGGSAAPFTVQAAKSSKAQTETTQEAKESDDKVEEALEEVLSSKVSISDEIGKEETVYVVSDNTGKAETVIVSDWLKNPDGKEKLEDASDLKDIKNVKGKEKFEEKDGKITWTAKGNDIYYQGNTTKKLPVEQTITYYLDGKKMDPDKIAGKSGKVTIRFDYKNNEKTTTTVDGKKYNVYVPFTILTGMVLDDSYSNVEVKNGKVISDGDSQFVAGIAMPGLKESLRAKSADFAGNVEIPEYIEVTADVKDFKLDMTMSVMLSGISTGKDIENIVNLGNLDSAIDTLSDSSTQLADGTKELRSGLELLRSNLPALTAGVNALNSSTGTLRDGIAQLDNTLRAPMSNEAKEAAASQAAALVDSQAAAIKAQAAATVDGQAAAIGAQAEAAVDSQAGAIGAQAEAAVDSQAEAIGAQAEAAVDSQAEAIAKQAEAAVDSQAEAIAAQAEAAVDSQAEAIAAQAGSEVANSFKNGTDTYNQIYNGAKTQFTNTMTSAQIKGAVAAGLKKDAQVVNVLKSAKMDDAAIEAFLTQVASGVMDSVAAIGADASAKGVVDACQTAATSAAQAAAVSGAKQGAAQGAVSGAKEAAKTAAVSGAKQGAAQGAVSGAKEAAKTAAVSGAKEAAKTAAVSGAKQGAGEGAVSGAKQGAAQGAVAGAEAAKAEVAAGIEAKTESGYSLVSGMEALKNGTQALANQVPTLSDGVNKLADGSKTLNEGMIKFDQEGIQKLADTYNGDVKSLMERVAAVMKAGSEYQTFSDKDEETVGEVKFIIRTEGVKAKED